MAEQMAALQARMARLEKVIAAVVFFLYHFINLLQEDKLRMDYAEKAQVFPQHTALYRVASISMRTVCSQLSPHHLVALSMQALLVWGSDAVDVCSEDLRLVSNCS